MKNLLVLSVMFLGLSANAGNAPLLTLKSHSGFSPRPSSSQITIFENGKIVRVIQAMREVTRETLGKLSVNSVSSIKEKIETISDNAVLVDLYPEAPKCMDAPSSSVAVNKNGKEITLKERASCHTYEVQDGEAHNLVELVTAFGAL